MLGFCTVLVAGEAPRIDHEYPAIDPLGALPVAANDTACPGAIIVSEAGLVIVPVGGVSEGAVETCTNCASDGTPALFNRKIL